MDVLKTIITVSLILFLVIIKSEQNIQEYSNNINQKKDKINEKQNTTKKLLEEFVREIDVSCEKPGWDSKLPAYSCKSIRDSGDSKGDGWYWINPEKSGNPLNVYCDMTTDGGGWLLISNITMESSTPPSQLPVKTSYRGITSDQMVLTKTAMIELRSVLSFTQLRFHCSKNNGRTFHLTTADNSTGEAVVQYFSGQTDVQPASCGSYVTMENDNSRLAGVCKNWGKESGSMMVGKWGYELDQDRLYDHPAFSFHYSHWALNHIDYSGGVAKRWECDDLLVGVTTGDFWKIYVR